MEPGMTLVLQRGEFGVYYRNGPGFPAHHHFHGVKHIKCISITPSTSLIARNNTGIVTEYGENGCCHCGLTIPQKDVQFFLDALELLTLP